MKIKKSVVATHLREHSFSALPEIFEKYIFEQGYTKQTAQHYRNSANRLCNELEQRNVGVHELSDEMAQNLFEQIISSVSPIKRKYNRYCLERFRDYLIKYLGAPLRISPPLDMSAKACLRREYKTYLKEVRGLADNTINSCIRFFERFLNYLFGTNMGDFNKITPADIISFILDVRKQGKAPRDKVCPSHLRTFFSFLFWSGKTKQNLSNLIPHTKQPKPTLIPRYLSPSEINQLINAAREDDHAGIRNYAIMLLIARLGLRATEVVAIRLSDIDWRKGEIVIRGKGQLQDRMPIPYDVGEAIVDYIKKERQGPEQILFVSSRAPFRRFKDAQIVNYILQNAYNTTGIKPPQSHIGSHILRHSLATDMLRKGATLEEIRNVLRHRSSMTTTIYAKNDIDMLRGLARSWPIGGEVL